MSMILCSTGALIGKPNGRNYDLLEPLSKELECDGFEFMMYESWYKEADRLVQRLLEMNLSLPVMHCEKHIGEAISLGENDEAFRRFTINCDIAEKIGAKKMVVHLWDGITSDSNFANNTAAYAKLKEICDAHGLELLIENVVCNCEDPLTHWVALQKEYPDIRFVFDTKMAAFHGQTELLYAPEYEWLWKGGHIRHYHVNDYAGGIKDWSRLKTLAIGLGNVDFARFFDFIRRIGYDDTFTTESTAFNAEGVVDTEMLNKQFRYIREQLGKEN